MRRGMLLLALFLSTVRLFGADKPDILELQARRQRAAAAFRDGILLIHATAELSIVEDGFRQDPFFYYYTGLENTPGAIFALDGNSGETWLFLPTRVPFVGSMPPEVSPDRQSAAATGIRHIVNWSELATFLKANAKTPKPLYYISDPFAVGDLPPDLQATGKNAALPLWIVAITLKWPQLQPKDAFDRIHYLTAVESPDEISASRSAATATMSAFAAGLKAIRPGVTQRAVESAVESACWTAGAHGSSFWPWAMSGRNAVFPHPFWSMARYDHLDSTLQAGDLVRFDIGCEWEHYGGDLGRTVPVSGKYTAEQREIWDVLVAAYQAAVKTFREGTTEEQVFSSWRDELLRQRATAKHPLTRRAIDLWLDRRNDRFWQMHTMNLDAGFIEGPLRSGMVIDFEPIVSIDDLGFYLEDMFLIKVDGAEDLTPKIPFTADEIEAAMGRQ